MKDRTNQITRRSAAWNLDYVVKRRRGYLIVFLLMVAANVGCFLWPARSVLWANGEGQSPTPRGIYHSTDTGRGKQRSTDRPRLPHPATSRRYGAWERSPQELRGATHTKQQRGLLVGAAFIINLAFGIVFLKLFIPVAIVALDYSVRTLFGITLVIIFVPVVSVLTIAMVDRKVRDAIKQRQVPGRDQTAVE